MQQIAKFKTLNAATWFRAGSKPLVPKKPDNSKILQNTTFDKFTLPSDHTEIYR